MQRLEVSGAVRPIYVSLGVKRLNVFVYMKSSCLSGGLCAIRGNESCSAGLYLVL